MKNIIDIYEGVLSDVETSLNTDNMKEMIDQLYDQLCNGTRETFTTAANWLKQYFDSSSLKVHPSYLGVYRRQVYPKDTDKDYIEFMPIGSSGRFIIHVVVQGMAFSLTDSYPMEKRFDRSMYTFTETQCHFLGQRGENIYYVPDSLKPLIDRFIASIFRIAKLRKKLDR